MSYKPGLHILSEIKTSEMPLLQEYLPTRTFLFQKIKVYELTCVGEVFHNFEGGGFTGVICLTESHLAIHTWPEFEILTLDIYLSNCKKVNDHKTQGLFNDLVRFFKSSDYTKKEVQR